MSTTSSSAGPSRHRRKQTAENWDDDFEFVLPSRSRPHASSSSSKHLDQDTGASRANRKHDSGYKSKGVSLHEAKGKDIEEEEDWDTGGKWEESPPGKSSTARTSIQVRRGSKGPGPLVIPSSEPARYLGPPRSSTSSTSPLPSPPPRASSVSAQTSHMQQESVTAGDLGYATAYVEQTTSTQSGLMRRHPSTSFAPLPTPPTVAISNDSSSSLSSWTRFNRSSPNLPPSPLPHHDEGSGARKPERERELRHMKSGEIMPPPPLPGVSLLRRKSKKDKDKDRAEIRESGVPFSPSMEQLRDLEGKRGFWKRLSGNTAVAGKGSPISLQSTQELRRRRSSSIGSPTKLRPNLSPIDQPPLPALPSNVRSPSAASSASASSATSASSRSAFRPTGISGILRRSTSSLVRRSPSGVKSAGTRTPPSAFASPDLAGRPPSPIPTRTSSHTSQLSVDSRLRSDKAGEDKASEGYTSTGGTRNSSISRGYHLPSPAPGSPYHTGGYFNHDKGGIPPLPHSASLGSQMSARSHRDYNGSITSTDTEPEEDEAQITPKGKKTRPLSTAPSARSRTGGTGWGGEGWTGFPATAPAGLIDASGSLHNFPALLETQHILRPIPSRTSSRTDLRIPSSQSMYLPPSTTLSPPLPTEPPPGEASRSFSTLRRLSSLSKKHGRRLSGGFKFGTGSSTSTTSSAEERRDEGRRRGKLETVVGSPIKADRQGEERGEGKEEDEKPVKLSTAEPGASGRVERIMATASDPAKDRYARAGSVSAPNSVLKPPMPRDPDAEWDKLAADKVTGLPPSGTTPVMADSKVSKTKVDKERRRQSWNDFVIPRNVLDKQRELKKGIEGVKRFAGGVETLKTLLAAHSDLSLKLSLSNDPNDFSRFADLDREFTQWWEMATVLIEVGSTGQAAGQEQTVSLSPESPKRSRRITLASDEAKLASDLMRRAHSTPLHPPYIPPPTSSSSALSGKKEPRKSSLPDPQDAQGLLPGGGPPRASPDLWRASTGRQDLSKRQLEVLRTMLQTPVSDPSVPQRNDPLRTMSTISASSTSASVSGQRLDSERPEVRGTRSAFRPSISRASTTDSQASNRSIVHFDSPQSALRAGTPKPRGAETFPSPNDSAYIVPSQSFPSPLTASTLAYGRPAADPSKTRRGSKVGLAGLREFLRGLKGKESKRNLRTANPTSRPELVGTASSPQALVLSGFPRHNPSRDGLPLSPTSPTANKYPFAWRHRPTPSYTDLQNPMASPDTPPSHPSPLLAGAPDSRRPSDSPSIGHTPPQPSPSLTPSKPTLPGPPVSGKERKRPGLRGIFRGGSGSWSDLVNSDKRSSRESIPTTTPLVSQPYPRVGSGGSTESAPPPSKGLRLSPSMEHFGGTGIRSTSGPSRLSVTTDKEREKEREEGEMTVRPRKSRIMGLGWPEEAALARETGVARLGSANSVGSAAMSVGKGASSTGSGGGDGARGEDVDGGKAEEGDETPIALTPESLPVLLEYLRQCEAKLGEWKERVQVLERRAC